MGRLKEKSNADLLIFLAWVVYTVSYLGKVNYSANITQVIDFYQITKAQAGIVPTFLFFSYGIGQVVNGILCKKYNIKWAIFGSLFVSAIINLMIAFNTEFGIIKWFWMINGFALSVLWPSIIRLLSEELPKKDLGRSSVIMGTTVAAGTLIIYVLSSLYATMNNFKLAFYTASIAEMSVAVFWLLFYKKAVDRAENTTTNEVTKQETTVVHKTGHSANELKLLYISVCILSVCAIAVNLIKDGLSTWVPSILKEEYSASDSISILLTLFLPMVAIFGNGLALKMHKKIPDYITQCFIVFLVVGGIILIIIMSLSLKYAVLMLLSLIAVMLLASSLNSLITSIYPMFMRERVNSGLFAGVLNGFCYVGSTISSYGLGYISDKFGWSTVFWTLIAFCILICLIWCVYILIKRSLQQ